MKHQQPKCVDCPFYIYSVTFGSPDKPVWHCRDGFKPLRNDWYDCQRSARLNEQGRQQQIRDGLLPPDHEQLQLF